MNLHIDGCCINNGTPFAKAGWGIIIEKTQKEEYFGKLRVGKQTNSRAEIEALKKALELIMELEDQSYIIYTDSKNVVDWATGNSERKSNLDIWTDIENLVNKISEQKKNVFIKHVNKKQLSADNELVINNKLADKLANKGAKALLEELR